MHAYVQRGLLGVLVAGGITLLGSTAANAATTDQGPDQSGQSQSNQALNLGGNGISLGSVSLPVTVSGNTLGGGSGSTQNPTTVVSSADSSAEGSSSIGQSNTASGKGGGDQSQSNQAADLGGNAISGPAVSAPITVSGNTVGGDSSREKGPQRESSSTSTSNPTTVVSAADSSATGSSTIDQSNTATSKDGGNDGWKQDGWKQGDEGANQTQSNEALNLGGNGISGPTISVPVTIAGNTVGGEQGGRPDMIGKGQPQPNHESGSVSNPTTVVSVADSSATGSSAIHQSNTATSKDGKDDGWKKGDDGANQSQSNKALNLGGNGISLGAISAPITIAGNTVSDDRGMPGKPSKGWEPKHETGSMTSNPTTVVSVADSSATGKSTIHQSNTATTSGGKDDGWKHDDGWKKEGGWKQHESGTTQTQSNKALNLGGNGISLGAISAPITVAGNTLGDDRGMPGTPSKGWEPKHETGSTTSNPTTVVSVADSSATGSSTIHQSNTATSKDGRADGWKHDDGWKKDGGWKQHESGTTQTQSNKALNLGGNGISGPALSVPVTVSGNTLGGHGSTSNPTTVLSFAGSSATGSSSIGQSNTASSTR